MNSFKRNITTIIEYKDILHNIVLSKSSDYIPDTTLGGKYKFDNARINKNGKFIFLTIISLSDWGGKYNKTIILDVISGILKSDQSFKQV